MLGVCYYPEHWPEAQWADDVRMMRELGLDYVRIGEFAWSRIEPSRDNFQFGWLDKAIDTLAAAGLKIVFGTPTATPPKWLIDEHPEILPVDPEAGRVRGFGSRRHYDFSSEIYQKEALRISEVLVKRYGTHAAIEGWQTDNEISCHDTTVSGSDAALKGFRAWCRNRYENIDALNQAWGNVFWSMEYLDFDSIDLPILAVTETNPAHRLAFLRYSSDKVIEFHDKMVAVIRKYAPGKWVTHNFIPKEDLYIDTYALGAPIDFASYDNYPLGRADLAFADAPADVMRKYMRTGHPDFGAFYHDTTRSFSAGDFWVMEQQPGPVNWAPHNPRPLPGMVRFWSLEAFAHGAACVSYFRWRQVPYAQEQMHAALLRPDNSKATAWPEVEQVRHEIDALSVLAEGKQRAAVAIVTDVEALWITEAQRQGRAYDFRKLEFAYYSALRQLGVDVEFVSKDHALDGYDLVIAPCLPVVSDAFMEKCKNSGARIVFGPRSGSKTPEFSIPENLAPGAIQSSIPAKVLSVETLRADCPEPLIWNEQEFEARAWCEELQIDDAEVIATYGTGEPAAATKEDMTYLGTVTDESFLKAFLKSECEKAGLTTFDLPEDMRLVRRGNLQFAFNFAAEPQAAPVPDTAEIVLGNLMVGAHDVTIWRLRA